VKKAVFYGVVLIGIYVLATNATGSGTIITSATGGATNVIAALQGRSTTS
jgi:hypothetical protein